MKKKIEQDQIFLDLEGDKYFKRNGPRINWPIYKAVNFIKPKNKSKVLEIGCGCGSTLKKIKSNFGSDVWGVDTSKKAIEYSRKINKLNNTYVSKFLSFNKNKKFDVVISGGFLYVTPDHQLKKTIIKMLRLIKKNGFLIIWDYDSPVSYKNKWKYHKKIKAFKRDILKYFFKFGKKFYLVSKYLVLKDGKKISSYNKNVNIDNIFSVMIIRKTNVF